MPNNRHGPICGVFLFLALTLGGKGSRTFQCFDCDGPDPLKSTEWEAGLRASYSRRSKRPDGKQIGHSCVFDRMDRLFIVLIVVGVSVLIGALIWLAFAS
jgi:hypothetical protein